jgi:2-desacetyl-2-hydroxyethyl bacteriochlorophyllide A dehydrogenase
MKAAVLVEPKQNEVRELPDPEVSPDEVLVKVEACGACYSEFDKWSGTRKGLQYPLVLGHEASGVIESVGEKVTSFKAGDRVAVMPTRPGTYTEYVNGGFAQYLSAPQERVVLIPGNVSYKEALGEPIACIVSGFERTGPYTGKRVAVVGCGFMGLILMQLLAGQQAGEILAIDVREEALEHAARFGAQRTLLPEQIGPEDKCVEWKQFEQGFDAVFEVTGAQQGLTLAGELVRVHGDLAIVGFHWGVPRNIDVGLWNLKAINVTNAHERRNQVMMESMSAGLELVSAGQLNMDALVTHVFPLHGTDEAFRAMAEKPAGFIKSVVLPWGSG